MSTKPILADAVIIGGGAAGSFCAITAARRGLSVIVLEPNEKIGRKLRITGKGRCNVTNNSDIRTVMNHIPDHSRFLYGALTRFSPEDTMQFYEDLGSPLKTERGGGIQNFDYIVEPDKKTFINDLIPKVIRTNFYSIMLDTLTAEHGARMTAMHIASDNADQLSQELKIQYNKARQNVITNELIDIVGGAEALNG